MKYISHNKSFDLLTDPANGFVCLLQTFETPLDPTVEWFPAVSLSEPEDAVKFLEDYPWRSARQPVNI